MADEALESVQEKVDAAIASLQKYMEDLSGEPASQEDAAIAIHNYATPRSVFYEERVELQEAVQYAVNARRRYQALDDVAEQHDSEEKARLVVALAALGEWSVFGGQVPRHHHMAALWLSSFRYGQNMTKYFGQDVGLDLRTGHVDRRRDLKIFAADDVIRLNKENPREYPMTMSTFDLIGKDFGVSGSSVREVIYPKKGKRKRTESSGTKGI